MASSIEKNIENQVSNWRKFLKKKAFEIEKCHSACEKWDVTNDNRQLFCDDWQLSSDGRYNSSVTKWLLTIALWWLNIGNFSMMIGNSVLWWLRIWPLTKENCSYDDFIVVLCDNCSQTKDNCSMMIDSRSQTKNNFSMIIDNCPLRLWPKMIVLDDDWQLFLDLFDD